MLFFKAFYRKKRTIIYGLIFMIILSLTLTLFSLITYYSQILNEWNVTNSVLLVEGNKDHFKEFNKYSNIIKIEKYIKFKFDKKKYPILKQQTEIINSSDGSESIITESSGNQNTTITWDDFTFNNNYVLIFESSNKNLKDNEIELFYNKEDYRFSLPAFLEDINNLIGKKLAFYDMNEEKFEFKISGFQDYNIPAMFVSKNTFNKIYKKSLTYNYKLTIDDYKKSDMIYKNILELEPTNNNLTNLINFDPPYQNEKNIIGIVKLLEFINNCLIFLFSIIFLIMLRNLIFDEKRSISLQKYLGFKYHQRKLLLFFEIFSLLTICLFTAIIISVLTNLLISNFTIKLNLLNFYPIIIIYCFLFILNGLAIIFDRE